MEFYTYIDWTLENTPRPFYVGKGCENRVRYPERNNKHRHVRNAHGFRREIVFTSGDEKECFAREVNLIAEYHTYVNDPLSSDVACNFTLGGEGVAGWHHRSDSKERIGNASRERMLDPSNRTRIAESLKGRERSVEHSVNISDGKRGKSNGLKGRKQSPETIQKRIETFKRTGCRKGIEPWNKKAQDS